VQQTELAKKIQYTNVRADATRDEIIKHCEQAAKYSFHAVMIQPCWISLAREILNNTDVRIATAICYPMGGETTAMKIEMANKVLLLGADEFDFQPNIGFLRSSMIKEFYREIEAIVRAAGEHPVKCMSEFGFLNEQEKINCITLAEQAGVHYIKNSSGVGPGGSPATPDDIRFIKSHLTGRAKIKASGQIKSYNQALALFAAGADLIGTSAGPEIINGLESRTTQY
jgi:deoxyribose-phosphate aldolase